MTGGWIKKWSVPLYKCQTSTDPDKDTPCQDTSTWDQETHSTKENQLTKVIKLPNNTTNTIIIFRLGRNPYTYFNQADAEFIQKTEKAKDWGGWLGSKAFKLKKLIAPELAPAAKKDKTDFNPPTNSKKRPAPKHIFVNLAKKRRVLGQKAREEMSDQSQESMKEDLFTTPSDKPAVAGGGGGAGKSTGNYNNTTEWKFIGDEVIITCNASRYIILNETENSDYTLQMTEDKTSAGVGDTDKCSSMKDSGHAQILTPWFVLDHNAWEVWMSPADFQHLSITCSTIQLIDLEQEIFNISIKTVTETATVPPQTQYTNDLTATILITEDTNIFPWSCDGSLLSTLGYKSWQTNKLHQFGYYFNYFSDFTVAPSTSSAGYTNKVDIPKFSTIFMTFENSIPTEILRTGDSWYSGKYKFNCNTVNLRKNIQDTRKIGSAPRIEPNFTENKKAKVLEGGKG
ncbi:uncharacterized protein [Notamacropus eugenii]|uniref:uncharacterized protein n=1 Tax=Notamacropus eugenii TaxID=9315 RepID=UPI003B674FF3